GEVRGFQPMEAAREKVSETYMNRPLRFGVAATRMALDAAGIGPGEVDPARMGVSMGAGAGLPAMESVIEEYRNHMKGGALDPSTFRAIGDEDWRRTFVLRSSHLASSDIHKIGRFFSGEYVRYTPTRGEFDIAK
ncbi:MAG: hypothetical protein H8D56_16200, partial [Planctomycetes bacterium]|nr:hypothetical protein [Planctomycetota bacterium]